MHDHEPEKIAASFAGNKRYLTFSHYLKKQFGEKVWKIPVHGEFTCPNRDGTRGTGGCLYCNNYGFSPDLIQQQATVENQIKAGIERIQEKRNVSKFIVYFQTYTNTYAPLAHLKHTYDAVLQFKEIVGMAIGTRPDCVDENILDLLASYKPRLDVWIEYGLQSIHNRTLAAINRGHTYEDFLHAIEITAGSGLKICIHVIIGLPGEAKSDILNTAVALSKLNFDAIKIHPLQVHTNTKLEAMHRQGKISLLSLKSYVDILCDFIELLPPTVVIQRLTAEAPDQILVAPDWCRNKMAVIAAIDAELEVRKSWQGKRFIHHDSFQ